MSNYTSEEVTGGVKGDLTLLQRAELTALAATRGQRKVLQLISALRRYRAASKKLLDNRYRDGECDSAQLVVFASELRAIEALEEVKGE